MTSPQILPSLLGADFSRLAEQIAEVESAGAAMLHFDVMDGHFVPNISMGPPVLQSVRRVSRSIIDVHLMIDNPDALLPAFVEAGADQILVHQEACPHLDRTIEYARKLGAKAGVVINPATPVSAIEEVLEIVDHVLVMSVNPGFGGQKFISRTLRKTRQLDRIRRERGFTYAIEMDGGIDETNVQECVRAGCDWLVMGTAIFGNPSPGDTVRRMTGLAVEAASIRV